MQNKTESPFGSPKFLAALAITFLSLWGWQYYMNQAYPTKTVAPGASAQVGEQTKGSVAAEAAATEEKPATSPAPPTAAASEFKYQDDTVSFAVSSDGMGLSFFESKKYKDHDGKNINFSAKAPLFGVLSAGNRISFNTRQLSATEFIGEAIVDGKKIERKLTYNPATNSLQSEISFESGLTDLTVEIEQKKAVHKNTNFLMPSFELQDFVFIASGKTQSEVISTLKDGEGLLKSTDQVSMVSIGTQYFTVAMINQADILPTITNKVENGFASSRASYALKDVKINKITQLYYVGAKKTEVLNAIHPSLSEVLNYGMFGAISKLLLKLLTFMHQIFGNWGLAIIGMTLVVRIITLPFNVMSFRSAQAMQKIKPEMDALREKFKGDPMRMNRETMDLMKRHKANPVSGCLPMLLQIPVFFALWRAISSSVELYQQPFFAWITDLSSHDQYFVLPVLMGVTMYLQQKLTPTTMDPVQAKILNFMPIIFTLFMVTLPSGLTLYNFISALFGVTQQYFLLKQNKTNAATTA